MFSGHSMECNKALFLVLSFAWLINVAWAEPIHNPTLDTVEWTLEVKNSSVEVLDAVEFQIRLHNPSQTETVIVDRRLWDPSLLSNFPGLKATLIGSDKSIKFSPGMLVCDLSPGRSWDTVSDFPASRRYDIPPGETILIPVTIQSYLDTAPPTRFCIPGTYRVTYQPTIEDAIEQSIEIEIRAPNVSDRVNYNSLDRAQIFKRCIGGDPHFIEALESMKMGDPQRLWMIQGFPYHTAYQTESKRVYVSLLKRELSMEEFREIAQAVRITKDKDYCPLLIAKMERYPDLHALIAYSLYDLDPATSLPYLMEQFHRDVENPKPYTSSAHLPILEQRIEAAKEAAAKESEIQSSEP